LARTALEVRPGRPQVRDHRPEREDHRHGRESDSELVDGDVEQRLPEQQE